MVWLPPPIYAPEHKFGVLPQNHVQTITIAMVSWRPPNAITKPWNPGTSIKWFNGSLLSIEKNKIDLNVRLMVWRSASRFHCWRMIEWYNNILKPIHIHSPKLIQLSVARLFCLYFLKIVKKIISHAIQHRILWTNLNVFVILSIIISKNIYVEYQNLRFFLSRFILSWNCLKILGTGNYTNHRHQRQRNYWS